MQDRCVAFQTINMDLEEAAVYAIKAIFDLAEAAKNCGSEKGSCALDIKNMFNSVRWKNIISALIRRGPLLPS